MLRRRKRRSIYLSQTRICAAEMAVSICGPLRVPKSAYVTLAHKRKPKFFYFGCSLVRRFYCKIKKNSSNNGTDGQTDRVRRNMRPPPREEGRRPHNKQRTDSCLFIASCFCFASQQLDVCKQMSDGVVRCSRLCDGFVKYLKT